MDRKTFCSLVEILTCDPLIIQNGQFHTYCISIYGITHQDERVTDGKKMHRKPEISSYTMILFLIYHDFISIGVYENNSKSFLTI